jgi:hypothetical protein
MKPEKLRVGKIYMIVGGHIMRYQGTWKRPDKSSFYSMDSAEPACAFRDPSAGVVEPPSGGSVSAEDVMYEITVKHIPMLRQRVKAGRARNLNRYADEMEFVIKELSDGEEEQ